MHKRARIALAVLGTLILTVVAVLGFHGNIRNDLTVTNQSGIAIQLVEITLPWEALRIEGLENGAARSKTFSIKHDAHFDVSVRLSDGTRAHSSDGYVTNGQYGEKVLIEVQRGGAIKFSQGGRPSTFQAGAESSAGVKKPAIVW